MLIAGNFGFSTDELIDVSIPYRVHAMKVIPNHDSKEDLIEKVSIPYRVHAMVATGSSSLFVAEILSFNSL